MKYMLNVVMLIVYFAIVSYVSICACGYMYTSGSDYRVRAGVIESFKVLDMNVENQNHPLQELYVLLTNEPPFSPFSFIKIA